MVVYYSNILIILFFFTEKAPCVYLVDLPGSKLYLELIHVTSLCRDIPFHFTFNFSSLSLSIHYTVS